MADEIQWEYRLETFGTYWTRPKDELLQATLDEWGEEGWEVINIVSSSGEKLTLIAKRPLSRSTRRQRTWPG
jgi:hypothetical protein